jgi:hypothetical protein
LYIGERNDDGSVKYVFRELRNLQEQSKQEMKQREGQEVAKAREQIWRSPKASACR